MCDFRRPRPSGERLRPRPGPQASRTVVPPRGSPGVRSTMNSPTSSRMIHVLSRRFTPTRLHSRPRSSANIRSILGIHVLDPLEYATRNMPFMMIVEQHLVFSSRPAPPTSFRRAVFDMHDQAAPPVDTGSNVLGVPQGAHDHSVRRTSPHVVPADSIVILDRCVHPMFEKPQRSQSPRVVLQRLAKRQFDRSFPLRSGSSDFRTGCRRILSSCTETLHRRPPGGVIFGRPGTKESN